MRRSLRALSLAIILGTSSLACDSEPAEEAPAEASDQAPAADEAAEEGTETANETDEENIEELASGQWVQSDLYAVRFRVPGDWDVRRTAEAVSATAPDGSTTVLLAGSESDNTIQAAINDLKTEVEFKDINFDNSGLTTINGMPGTRGTGSAVIVEKDGDREIQFLGYAVRVGTNNVTLMVFSDAAMYEAQKDVIDGIAQTLTRI
ncbi:hypothetical protein DV096_18160 [Bradymonadaceae bacterium TMQ3]|uniref:DUF1795 domain-containing protein n=1 Tax=Lujinxingia sediminis TaxID=2480984 RepID=A0ABY0CV83_9DELT|nr:hypothetical protein [Lujinxingia sediminis]RDV36668.1 hypothetical protein DV096_18160 [Bradymonadaceae bacterium TMQ3]RVU46941.1 hypothetical protein EA187_07340 [Lujinxingia sediminis]TXC68551.1 hypothetical protein FRC91_18405 [Bradymonadales bacterium TMQ1]